MARFDRLELDLPLREEAAEPMLERDEHYWLAKADEDRRNGCYENALRMYSRALEADKSMVKAWLGQVQMLISLDEAKEAEVWSRKALELFRNNGDLMAGRAQALGRIDKRKEAKTLSDAALSQDGQTAYRWMVRGELLVNDRKGLDRHCFNRAVQADPDWLVPAEIALIYLYHGNPGKGILWARQAVETEPESPYAWYVKGTCELQLELESQAVRSFTHCLEVSPNHADAQQRLVEIAHRKWTFKRVLRRCFGLS